MNDKRKSRPVAGTTERAETETAAFGEAYFSDTNDSTMMCKTQTIFDVLPQGETNAICSKALAELVGASSVRDLQNRIAAERDQGKLILSSCRGGYFSPSPGADGQAEIRRYISTLTARALNTLRALKAAKASLDNGIVGQVDFDELGAL